MVEYSAQQNLVDMQSLAPMFYVVRDLIDGVMYCQISVQKCPITCSVAPVESIKAVVARFLSGSGFKVLERVNADDDDVSRY